MKRNLFAALLGAGLLAAAVGVPAQSSTPAQPVAGESVDPCKDFTASIYSGGEEKGVAFTESHRLRTLPNNIGLGYVNVTPAQPDKCAESPSSEQVSFVFVDWTKQSKGWQVKQESQILLFTNNVPASVRLNDFTASEYGRFTNVATLYTTKNDEKDGDRVTEVELSYTVEVIPRDGTGNELPDTVEDPMGSSEGYDFGDVEIFDYKRGVAEITNIGFEDLAVRKAQIVDADGNEAPEFSVTGTNCKDGFIAPTRSCQVQVQFFPRVQGPRAAYIEVATNSPYDLQIPLNGVGTYEEPESIKDADEEAEQTGQAPNYEVAEPEQVEVSGGTTKNGKSVVKAKKKKIKVKWQAPDTDQPVTGYEIRKKFKKKKWAKWKAVDPMPNAKGWIKASVKAKKPGNYKVQVTSSTPWVERGDKATVKIKKEKKK